jgi:hypothetical protein
MLLKKDEIFMTAFFIKHHHRRLSITLGSVLLGLVMLPYARAEYSETIRDANASSLPAPPLNPNLKYATLDEYEKVIKSPGVMLDDKYVRLFAPKRKEKEAKIVFRYLVRAYDELYRLVGVTTEYKIVVYHFPEGDPNVFGGTSNCTLWYSEKNLELESYEEWKKYNVPHVCGYIEEMAHNFVSATGAQFGWEMIGWTIGTKVSQKVARNPIHTRLVNTTRAEQEKTFERYKQSGYVFPEDLPANQCDRIHAYLLWGCEKRYGPNFWPDFFREIRKERQRLTDAVALHDADKIRNKRYQITVECFDRLGKLNFKKALQRSHISLTVDVKSLHPEEPGWNRKLTP